MTFNITMSSNNVVLDSSNATLPAVPDSSVSSNLAPGPLALSSSPSGAVGGVKRFATDGVDLLSSEFGQIFDIRAHTQAAAFSSLFGACYVEKVILTLTSLVALETGSAPWIFRFGLIPRGAAMSKSDVPTAANLPWLHPFISGATHHLQEKVVFARFPVGNELPFPPGLQLDLNATEIRFKYPTPAVLHKTRKTANPYAVLNWHIEFELRGEGTSFGA